MHSLKAGVLSAIFALFCRADLIGEYSCLNSIKSLINTRIRGSSDVFILT